MARASSGVVSAAPAVAFNANPKTSATRTSNRRDRNIAAILLALGTREPYMQSFVAASGIEISGERQQKGSECCRSTRPASCERAPNIFRASLALQLFSDRHPRNRPGAVQQRGRGLLRPVQSQHQDELVRRSRQPIGLLALARVFVLQV